MTAPARATRATDRRRYLWSEVKTRAKLGTVPMVAPEVRTGLFYTNDGWRVREYGLVAQRNLKCWRCGNRLYFKRRPKEGVEPCHFKLLPDRRHECNAGHYVLSVRPGWLWFMDVAEHEELLIDLMTYDEILEWFDVEHIRLTPGVRAALSHPTLAVSPARS